MDVADPEAGMTPASVCEGCTAVDSLRLFKAREMMFGFRHVFDYGECRECGSIQIMHVPADLPDYYPDDYYSYQPPSTTRKAFRQWPARQRREHAKGRVNRMGGLLNALFGPPLTADIDWIGLAGIRREHRILDVGCGCGAILAAMREQGFRDLTGIDPHMRAETHSDGFVLLRKHLGDLTGPFDAVMLHHSFEHMPDPAGTLRHINRVLTATGVVLICTPVAGSYAWRTYGANWFQLDAPRHLFIPSSKGLGILARRTGFEVVETVYDSGAIQFTASEKYSRDIALRMPDDRRYTRREMRLFAEKARRLNEAMDGDQAAFVLRKASKPLANSSSSAVLDEVDHDLRRGPLPGDDNLSPAVQPCGESGSHSFHLCVTTPALHGRSARCCSTETLNLVSSNA